MTNIDLTEKGTKVFTTFNSPFLNTDALIIEYNDILRPLGFDLLRVLRTSDVINQIFDIDKIINMTDEELYEWYLYRDKINVLLNFDIVSEIFYKDYPNKEEFVYDFFNTEIELLDIPSIGNKLVFYNSIKSIVHHDLIKRVYVYYDDYNEVIERDIRENFGNNVKFIYGDFKEALLENNIGKNTSYIISDILKIEDIKDLDLLNYSSILINEVYMYNIGEDDEPMVDIDKLLEDYIFKIFFFTMADLDEEE